MSHSLFVYLIILVLTFSSLLLQSQNSSTPIELRTARERADEQFRASNWKDAAQFYEMWISSNPRDTTAHWNYARTLVKLNQLDKAVATLRISAAVGISNVNLLQKDPDFTLLRNRDDFKSVLATVTRNAEFIDNTEMRFVRQERFARYRILYPPKYDPKQKYHLVLLLHGNGLEPIVMLRWAKELQLTDVIFVCPEAAYTKVGESIALGRMRLSAAAEELGMPDKNKDKIMETSAQWYISALNDAEKSLPIYNELPIVMGFSQGGFYTSVLISRYPARFRSAVMMCSSYFDFAGIPERLPLVRRYGIDILQVHGIQDQVVPFQTAELFHNMIEKSGITTTFIPYEGTHWMSAEITKKISEWITSHFQ